uniref:ATP synthase F0 subunit 8 n=1 Tax=Provespa barthelemyi TaxID=743389 RepID=UPI002551E511|nr:ATP synthase F0 subunit 8 [Provespa barthelemyi]WGL39460.1 ATP synthase F0 subunit 8 [Provespa barthelemyi]
MPQLSPLKWFYLFIFSILILIFILIKMNFLFSNKINIDNNFIKKKNQMKWKI